MVERDVVLAKVAIIDRCLGRISEARSNPSLSSLDAQDITLINLQRAIQAAIDLAAHVVATEGYGLADTLASCFTLLEQSGRIDADLADTLRRMVGFRNVAVHQYQAVDPAIVDAIVEHHLGDLRHFARVIVEQFDVA